MPWYESTNRFMQKLPVNKDDSVVQGFGEEWSRFTQSALESTDRASMFEDFFSVFPWAQVSRSSVGADFGCGSGRWALLVAPRVGRLHVLDASEAALNVARENLKQCDNVNFHCASVEQTSLADDSLDFAYSLGVLHHVPDTYRALEAIVRKLKIGAPVLVYLYYAFDNRPWWFRVLWRTTDTVRQIVCRSPRRVRYLVSDAMALCIYWPLARTAKLLDYLGLLPSTWPLSWYRDRAFYVMRTDALDRFGTRLERRFTRVEIEAMMVRAGLGEIRFSERAPYWCAVGIKG